MSITLSLNDLENSGLIQQAQAEPELEYMFRHALVQDASYESLLKADRRTLHTTVAQILEGLYLTRLDEFAATLADHYERAENYPQALEYYLRAGKVAAKSYANIEAALLFSRAVKLIPHSNATARTIGDLFSQYGHVLELAGSFETAIENYRQMQAEAIQRREKRMEMDALIAQAVIQATPSPVHNVPQARSLCEQALVIADILQDREAESRLYWLLLIIHASGHEHQKAIEYGEKSLAIARAINHRERLAFTLNDISRSYYIVGNHISADAAIIEARALWEEIGNLPMLADNLISAAENILFRGKFTEALQLSQHGYEISKKINNIWGQSFSLSVQSNVYWYRGEPDASLACIQKINELDAKQCPPFVILTNALTLMEIYVEMGNYEGACSAMHELAQINPAAVENNLQGITELVQAYIAAARGDIPAAGRWLKNAKPKLKRTDPGSLAFFYIGFVEYIIAITTGSYAKLAEDVATQIQKFELKQADDMLALLRYRHGHALLHNEQLDEARAELSAALELSEQIETRHWSWRIHAALAAYFKQINNTAAEAFHQQKACELIVYIADHAPENLRASYLKLPEIQKVLAL